MKTVKINNIDFTSYLTPIGEGVKYKKILGNNGGTMLSGRTEEDILSWKAVVRYKVMPLTEVQQATFLTALMSSTVNLYYFDPATNGYRTVEVMVDADENKQKGKGGTGVEYWAGMGVTFTEK